MGAESQGMKCQIPKLQMGEPGAEGPGSGEAGQDKAPELPQPDALGTFPHVRHEQGRPEVAASASPHSLGAEQYYPASFAHKDLLSVMAPDL